MGDDNATHSSACRTDDDEFRAELERLNLSEREVSKEIARAIEAFQCAKKSQQSDNFRRDFSVDDSNTSIASKDTRESSPSSFPSDEACGSIIYEQREPPPEITTPRTPRTSNMEQHSTSDSTATSSGMQFVYDDPSADLLTADEHGSLQPDVASKSLVESMDVQERVISQTKEGKPAESTSEIRQCEATSQTDIERGIQDIFEEESFWGDGLWKTPVIENSKPNDKEWSKSTSEEAAEKRSVTSRPNAKDLAQLYLPDLKPRQDKQANLEVKSQSMSESEGDVTSNFQDEIESAYWDIKKEPREILEDQLDSQHSRTVRISVIDTTIKEEPQKEKESPSDEGERDKCLQRYCSFWRVFLVAVHVILFSIGAIVISKYLKNSRAKNAMIHPEPSHDECSLANHDHLLLTEMNDAVFGTTKGATNDTVICLHKIVSGIWYNTIGTGEQMVITASGELDVDPKVMVLSGPCGNLHCEGMSPNEKFLSFTSSVVWFSEADLLYHILVFGEEAGDFSIKLEETPSMNNHCVASTALLLPEHVDNITIAAQTWPSGSTNRCDSVKDLGIISSWFLIPGNGKFVSASICNVRSSAWANNDDVYLALLSGNCDKLDCALPYNYIQSNNVNWVSVHGESYYLVAWNVGDVPVSFDLCISQDEPGKSCKSATPTSHLLNKEGHVEIRGSIQATDNNVFDDSSTSVRPICLGKQIPTNAIWYTFKGTGDTVTASICGNVTNNISAVFDVLVGTACNTMSCVTNGRTGNCGANGQQFLSWTTDLDQQYWIAVYGDIPGIHIEFTLDLLGIAGSDGTAQGPSKRIPVSQQVLERSSTNKIVWICIGVIGSVCALFASIAWRWRRLKQSSGSRLPQKMTDHQE
jgi:hypothetical protein